MSDELHNQLRFALKSVASSLEQTEDTAAHLRAERARLMIQARSAGMKYIEIAQALGVTKAYVHQQVAKATKVVHNDA